VADRDEDTTMLTKSIIPHLRDVVAAERAHYLFIVDGPDKGRRIPIGSNPVVIGRSAPADIVLQDPQISRNHCRVCLAMDEIIVIDLESSNGTYIDGKRLAGGGPLAVGARLQVGSHVLEHEHRIRKEVEESQELDRDLKQAWNYIQSLLPAPLTDGPILSDWCLVPCSRLGGDAFGYRQIDPQHFAMYLIDVSGHGTGAAMHAVSVINVLRQPVLPDADYKDPSKVLAALNSMFRMESHGNLYLTVWYGVYDLETRKLTYAAAGHHASYLVTAGRETAQPLKTRNPIIGVAPEVSFKSESTTVPGGATLYVFSDGVFEITTPAGRDWTLEDFVELVRQPRVAGVEESQRLLAAVRHSAKAPNLDDDFSLMAFTFTEAGIRAPDDTWPNRR
jgi:serine phosphatase RsbU (regulator of sigma subunit)